MKQIIISLILISVLIISCQTDYTYTAKETGDVISESENSVKAPIEDSTSADKQAPIILAGTTSKLFEFNQEEYDKATNEGKSILLIFYANWCPNCREEEIELKEAFNELSREDLVGFKVSFKDSETDEIEQELARENGVVYQHTKVIIDSQGERILKDLEVWDKDKFLEQLAGE